MSISHPTFHCSAAGEIRTLAFLNAHDSRRGSPRSALIRNYLRTRATRRNTAREEKMKAPAWGRYAADPPSDQIVQLQGPGPALPGRIELLLDKARIVFPFFLQQGLPQSPQRARVSWIAI